MPPKGKTEENSLQSKITELKRLKSLGLLSSETYDQLAAEASRVALGLPQKVAAIATANNTTAIQLEDAASTGERKIEAVVMSWFGSKEKPMIAGDAWPIFMGEGEARELRDTIADTLSRSLLHRKLTALFREAGCGGTPKELEGDGATFDLARLAAWSFLAELGAKMGSHLCVDNVGPDTFRQRKNFEAILVEFFERNTQSMARMALRAGVSKLHGAEENATKHMLVKGAPQDKRFREEQKPTCGYCKKQHYGRCFKQDNDLAKKNPPKKC